ncbi:hypothetical protein [Chryseobacterium indoltheticum]|uniref:Uncharacterized protein n=1 Tax=Chryseobacterium indoltheticum TaxID=254 RepID=A0A381FA77_9FLAO|nr:hypothetical protein [Chryseobacterium indoltheticum]AZA73549.1 hypothetical protein EG358_07185 [Chryseobacterium indoltheticum]SIR24761.1 hypothetical protein SAMN05421682_115109 [Chryseobacterium indoltheticum]SUX43480.1 Uncharacterised protein [Chryseobacterium indoltheticum]
MSNTESKPLEELFSDLDYWSVKYEFTFQFWGDYNNNIFITKGGVNIYDTGGLESPRKAIVNALEYINKINRLELK